MNSPMIRVEEKGKAKEIEVERDYNDYILSGLTSGTLAQFFVLIYFFGALIGGIIVNTILSLTYIFPPSFFTFFVTLALGGLIETVWYYKVPYAEAQGAQWVAITYRAEARRWARGALKIKSAVDLGDTRVDFPDAPALGKYANAHFIDMQFECDYLPKMILICPDKFEICCSFVGTREVVENRSFFFGVTNITCVSVNYLCMTKDDFFNFIPVCILTDYSLRAEESKKEAKLFNLTPGMVNDAQALYHGKYGTEWFQSYNTERGIRTELENSRIDHKKEVKRQADAIVKDLRDAGEIEDPKTSGVHMPSGKNVLIAIGIIMFMAAVAAHFLRWW